MLDGAKSQVKTQCRWHLVTGAQNKTLHGICDTSCTQSENVFETDLQLLFNS